MISAIIGMMFYGIGLGAPSNADALEALQERFYDAHGGFVDPVSRIDDISVRFNRYPQYVTLKVCNDVRVDRRRVRTSIFDRGFSCLVEVIANGVPTYHVRGIFIYDGLKWRFIGSNQPATYRPQQVIRKRRGDGKIKLKPGSIPYEGRPVDPINDVESPYADILDRDSAYFSKRF